MPQVKVKYGVPYLLPHSASQHVLDGVVGAVTTILPKTSKAEKTTNSTKIVLAMESHGRKMSVRLGDYSVSKVYGVSVLTLVILLGDLALLVDVSQSWFLFLGHYLISGNKTTVKV
nr:hypothetical protein Iba_chr14bCG13780 [Ipomoea batatas]